jgi:hypothetical protein
MKRIFTKRNTQQGTTTVEFAFVGFLLFLILFGLIEVARVMFVMNSLVEVTRRAARVAVVCPVDHIDIKKIGTFNSPAGSDRSRYLQNLSTANFSLEYLNQFGAATTTFSDIDYVRFSISNYQHQMLIPGLNITINSQSFSTTMPVESLGYVPEINARECFGTA